VSSAAVYRPEPELITLHVGATERQLFFFQKPVLRSVTLRPPPPLVDEPSNYGRFKEHCIVESVEWSRVTAVALPTGYRIQCSRSRGRGLNPGIPEFKTEVLSTRARNYVTSSEEWVQYDAVFTCPCYISQAGPRYANSVPCCSIVLC
jgi:hypothetical protein